VRVVRRSVPDDLRPREGRERTTGEKSFRGFSLGAVTATLLAAIAMDDHKARQERQV